MSAAARVSGLVLCVTLLGWGGFYIARTSFEHEGQRVFSLWDDGMISMTYARNLSRGEGLRWNVGEEPVQGFSNPAVAFVMAGVHALPLDPFHTSLAMQLLNLALLIGMTLLAGVLARRLLEDDWLAVVVMASVALSASLGVWTLQGSDVGFVGFWLLGCLVWWVTRSTSENPWPPGLFALLAIGPLIRLDSVIYLVVFGACAVLLPGHRVRRVVSGGAILGGVGAAMLLASWLYYGDPLPNTFYLKATGADRGAVLASGGSQLTAVGPAGALLLLLAAFGAWRRRADPPLLVCASLSGIALVYHVWVGGDWAPAQGSRFLAPIAPLLLLLAAAGVRSLGVGRSPIVVAVAVLVLAVFSNPGPAIREWLDPTAPTFLRDKNERNVALALYLREQTTPDTTIAVFWGGVHPYFSERAAVDVWGKSDRHIAKLPAREFRPGHSKWDWVYLVDERKPDLILGHRSPRLARLKSFVSGYYRVKGPSGFDFYVRKHSLDKLLDASLQLSDLETGAAVSRG
jgi:hypothetical protein